MSKEKYRITIGIECHVQLNTKSKLFSGADNDAVDKEPNSCVSPVDYALPGMLPVLNKAAVEKAILAGKAMNCTINPTSRFDRKHYFYPDLPKGYQISQMYQPIIGAGEITLADGSTVKIEHAHLEEDAGKLTHYSGYSLVDLNRAGTPLIEIVSMPDIHSAEQARLYCEELHRLMVYAGVSNGDLYQGNMRFDVNISISDNDKLGTRAEIKNLNSFRSVERAVEYEFERQKEILERPENKDVYDLFKTIEIPILDVVVDMELEGFDRDRFEKKIRDSENAKLISLSLKRFLTIQYWLNALVK